MIIIFAYLDSFPDNKTTFKIDMVFNNTKYIWRDYVYIFTMKIICCIFI